MRLRKEYWREITKVTKPGDQLNLSIKSEGGKILNGEVEVLDINF